MKKSSTAKTKFTIKSSAGASTAAMSKQTPKSSNRGYFGKQPKASQVPTTTKANQAGMPRASVQQSSFFNNHSASTASLHQGGVQQPRLSRAGEGSHMALYTHNGNVAKTDRSRVHGIHSTRGSVNQTPSQFHSILGGGLQKPVTSKQTGELRVQNRPSEEPSTAYTSVLRGNTDISKMISKNWQLQNSSHFKINESGKTSSCYSTRGGDLSMQQAAAGPGNTRRTRARHAAGHEAKPKVSAYMQRFQAVTDVDNYWESIRNITTHQNKIENLDAKIAQERGFSMEPKIPTSLNMRAQTPRQRVSHFRGQGGILQEMNGVQHRHPTGSAQPEHNLAGAAMSDIIKPRGTAGRRSQSVQQMYGKASEQIGSNAETFKKEAVDPASVLKADKNFRKASVASSKGLWVNDKEVDLLTEKKLNRYEICKTKSRERYFSSQISTLPGPVVGLNCVKTRQQQLDNDTYNDHVQRKKGYTFDKFYSSHINTLPGTHNSSQLTQEQVDTQKEEQFQRKTADPKFQLKNQILYGSYMQECQREDAGLPPSRAVTDTPSEFRSYQKGYREQNQHRTPSQVSMDARHKNLYSSNFTLN